MSADNITACPACGEFSLREYKDVGLLKTGILEIDYFCTCKACLFEWRFSMTVTALAYRSNPIPPKLHNVQSNNRLALDEQS